MIRAFCSFAPLAMFTAVSLLLAIFPRGVEVSIRAAPLELDREAKSGSEKSFFIGDDKFRYSSPLSDVAMTPNGDVVAGLYDDGNVVIWNGANGTRVHSFPVTNARFLALSGDASLVSISEETGAITIYNARDGSKRLSLDCLPIALRELQLKPGESRGFPLQSWFADRDRNLLVEVVGGILCWNITNSELAFGVPNAGAPAFCAATETLFYVNHDREIVSRSIIPVLAPPRSLVDLQAAKLESIAISVDGQYLGLVTGALEEAADFPRPGLQYVLQIYDCATLKIVRALELGNLAPDALALGVNGRLAIVHDNHLELGKIANPAYRRRYSGTHAGFTRIAFTADNEQMLLCGIGRPIASYKLDDDLQLHYDPIDALAVSSAPGGGEEILVTHVNNMARYQIGSHGLQLMRSSGLVANDPYSVMANGDAVLEISGTRIRTTTSKALRELDLASLKSLGLRSDRAVSRNGRIVAVASDDSILVYDLQQPSEPARLTFRELDRGDYLLKALCLGELGDVLAISLDGRRSASVIYLWNWRHNWRLKIVDGPPATSLLFGDGDRLFAYMVDANGKRAPGGLSLILSEVGSGQELGRSELQADVNSVRLGPITKFNEIVTAISLSNSEVRVQQIDLLKMTWGSSHVVPLPSNAQLRSVGRKTLAAKLPDGRIQLSVLSCADEHAAEEQFAPALPKNWLEILGSRNAQLAELFPALIARGDSTVNLIEAYFSDAASHSTALTSQQLSELASNEESVRVDAATKLRSLGSRVIDDLRIRLAATDLDSNARQLLSNILSTYLHPDCIASSDLRAQRLIWVLQLIKSPRATDVLHAISKSTRHSNYVRSLAAL